MIKDKSIQSFLWLHIDNVLGANHELLFNDFNGAAMTVYCHIVAIVSSDQWYSFSYQLDVYKIHKWCGDSDHRLWACEKMRFITIEADGGHRRTERLKESLFAGPVGIIQQEIPCSLMT
jgi:hypothetical protein